MRAVLLQCQCIMYIMCVVCAIDNNLYVKKCASQLFKFNNPPPEISFTASFTIGQIPEKNIDKNASNLLPHPPSLLHKPRFSMEGYWRIASKSAWNVSSRQNLKWLLHSYINNSGQKNRLIGKNLIQILTWIDRSNVWLLDEYKNGNFR